MPGDALDAAGTMTVTRTASGARPAGGPPAWRGRLACSAWWPSGGSTTCCARPAAPTSPRSARAWPRRSSPSWRSRSRPVRSTGPTGRARAPSTSAASAARCWSSTSSPSAWRRSPPSHCASAAPAGPSACNCAGGRWRRPWYCWVPWSSLRRSPWGPTRHCSAGWPASTWPSCRWRSARLRCARGVNGRAEGWWRRPRPVGRWCPLPGPRRGAAAARHPVAAARSGRPRQGLCRRDCWSL